MHAYRDGHAPGIERLDKLGLTAVPVPSTAAPARTRRCCSPTQGRRAAGGGEHPRVAGRVPGQGPGRDGVDIPHQAPGRPEARRCRKGCPGSIAARSRAGTWCCWSCRRWSRLVTAAAVHRPRQRGRQPVAGADPDLIYWMKNCSREARRSASDFRPTGELCLDQLPLPHRVHDGGLPGTGSRHRGRGHPPAIGRRGAWRRRPHKICKQVQDLRAELSRRDRAGRVSLRGLGRAGVGEVVTAGLLAGTRVAVVSMPDAPTAVVQSIQHRRDDGRGTAVQNGEDQQGRVRPGPGGEAEHRPQPVRRASIGADRLDVGRDQVRAGSGPGDRGEGARPAGRRRRWRSARR